MGAVNSFPLAVGGALPTGSSFYCGTGLLANTIVLTRSLGTKGIALKLRIPEDLPVPRRGLTPFSTDRTIERGFLPHGRFSPCFKFRCAPSARSFAPSPTGYLHVGGARTALFNWLFARHCGGTLVLRIEDTDAERSTAEMVEGILQGLRWLGLDWDEGPYYQTQRVEMYRQMAGRLLASGHAYYCFCTKDELEGRRAAASAAGRPPKYDGTCRKIPLAEAAKRQAAGDPAAVRFAVPQSGSTVFEDAVFGRVEFANSELEDFVLLRSDGGPTYHLSVVTDDVDMHITHVIRGADHLSNTPKQVLLYQALGATLPIFAHVPLILGPDKTRLSKRHGATSVIAYRDEGIVPEAFRNFLALLGWTPPEGTPEILGDVELIRLFTLDAVSRSNAVFDRGKLDWFNTEYIRAYSAEKLLPLIEEEWKKAGVMPERTDVPWLLATIDLLKPAPEA